MQCVFSYLHHLTRTFFLTYLLITLSVLLDKHNISALFTSVKRQKNVYYTHDAELFFCFHEQYKSG